MTILDKILDKKREELIEATAVVSAVEMRDRAESVSEAPRGFRAALSASASPAIIAEIKRRSPSRGLIREDFDPVALARGYEEGGAAALSVLTDESFFGGDLEFLKSARAAVNLPVLRKDFVIDPYQIDEARWAGADAVLLIVAALTPSDLASLYARAVELGLDVLVEVHDEQELAQALECGAPLLGVNNRNLRTFEVDLAVTERLAGLLGPDQDVLLVAESGIHHTQDIDRLELVGARAFLVGESLMRQPDVKTALNELRRNQ